MPHVDVWAKIQAEAGDISQAAEARTTRRRFTIFSGLQLLAPAFVVLLVFGATLLNLAEDPAYLSGRTTNAPLVESVTAALPTTDWVAPAAQTSSLAYDRLMARYADRLEGALPNHGGAQSDVVDAAYVHELHTQALTPPETRDDMRAEWREYVEQRQPRHRNDALHLIRPFLSNMTPQ